MLKNIYLILLILCSFSLSAQLLDVDFDADPTGTITTTPGGDYYWIDNGACGSDWEVTTGIGSVTCSSCSGNLAGIQYGISGCFLDATLVVSVDIFSIFFSASDFFLLSNNLYLCDKIS